MRPPLLSHLSRVLRSTQRSDSQKKQSKARKRSRKNDRGFFTIWNLGLCVSVLSLGGVIFDVWHAFSDRRAVSSIVDAAAIAGANQVDLDIFRENGTVVLNEDNARAAAAAYVDNAIIQEGLDHVETTVELQDTAIAVTTTVNTRLTFTALLLTNPELPVTVTGVADPQETQ